MQHLITVSGKVFDVLFAAPAEYIRPDIFIANIINSDIDTVHNTFKYPSETVKLKIELDGDEMEFEGFTKYLGFTVIGESIQVQLQKV